MARDRLVNFRADDDEYDSMHRSCERHGVTMSDAFRAFVTAMSGGELSVIRVDDEPQVALGPNWVTLREG